MANTIQLKLLENKSIVAEVNGRNYAYEGGYNIVAGERNATEFEIVSVPAQYKDAQISLSLTNSLKQPVLSPIITNNKFTLPVGMAIAGYGQIVITLTQGEESVPFLPLKIKVANTDPDWKSGVIQSKISIGGVVTLAPDSQATVTNIGTDTNAVLVFGIPEGQGFKVDITYPSVLAMQEGYATDGVRMYGFALIDTGNVNDEDNAKLYIKGVTEYQYLTDLSGAQGIQGPKGNKGVGIESIQPFGVDADGGNIYEITLTNGATYSFTAPKGATGAAGTTGATGNGIQSTAISYATSTSGTTVPTSWQTSIPTVSQGQYLWTRTVTTYTDSNQKVSYSVAYQGKDAVGAVTGVKGNNETTYRTGQVNLTPANIGAMPTTGGTFSGNITAPKVTASSQGLYDGLNRAWSNGNRPTARGYYDVDDDNSIYADVQTDTVVKYYRSSDGNTWYRIYSSGWKEMGGIVTGATDFTVTLPTNFNSPNYVVSLTYNNTTDTSSVNTKNFSAWDKNVHSFKIRNGSANIERSWRAEGY